MNVLLASLHRHRLFHVVFFGIALSGVLLFCLIPKSSMQGSSTLRNESVVLSNQEQPFSGLPLRLKIPAINVDAVVEHVGLTPAGAMDVPKNPADVAWFNLGPRPGEIGSAVMAGHYGWKDDLPMVFNDLHTLHIGDKVSVEDEKGEISTFVVREFRTYGLSEDTTNVFRSSDGQAHLNLITCEGVWDKVQQSYSKRFVVFTDRE